MLRLTISLPDTLHNRIAVLAMQHDDSKSNIINRLIQTGSRY
jgi:predicted transcriptional regulator